jgi:predicted PurR-regulated permease PerM
MRVWLAERPLVIAIVLTFALWILLTLIQQAIWVLAIVVISLVTAAAISPIVARIRLARFPPHGWRIPKVIAVLLVYLVGIAIILFVLYEVVDAVVREALTLIANLPVIATQFSNDITRLEQSLGISGFAPSADSLIGQAQALAGLTAAGLQQLVQGVFSFFFSLFAILILTLFMVVESDRILSFWLRLFPPSQRVSAKTVTIEVGRSVSRWVIGQMTIAAITGTLAGGFALLIGLPYPSLFGAITTLLDLAPILGPSVMAIPAFILALEQSPLLAIVAGAYFIGLSEFEGHVLQPVITGRVVRISPILVIIAVPLGLALYGAIGGIMAVPAAAATQVIAQRVLLPWLDRLHENPENSEFTDSNTD